MSAQVGRELTSTRRRPLLARPASAAALRHAAWRAAALACAALVALAAAATAFALGYVAVRVGGRIAAGDPHGAARWATLAFAAATPFALGYVALVGYSRAAARARGERTAARIGVLAVAAPAAVIALAVALHASLSASSYFVTDDWLHIVIAHDALTGSGLDMHYLGRVVFIHYAPGHRLAYYLLAKFAPLDWGAALTVMLVLFAGALAFFHRICTRLFGRRPSNLVLLGLFGTSVLLVPSFLWFADALHKFPSMLLSLIAIDAYLSYRAGGRRRALALCIGCISLGSLFYIKILLVPLYLVLIRVLFLERRPEHGLRTIVAERWTWLAFVPTYVIYGLNYFLNYAHTGSAPPSLHLLGKYLWIAWFRGVTPAFAGVNVGFDAKGAEVLYAVGAQILLVAVIAWTIRRKRSAWRAWAFWLVAFAANATVVALGRLGSLGIHQVGSQLRYDTEMTWLLPLALGFALFAGEVAGRPAEPRALRPMRLPSKRVRYGLVAVVACAYLAATIDTGVDNARQWRFQASNQAKTFATNMKRTAEQQRGATLLDDQTPAFLIAPTHKPWNRLERFVPAITDAVRVVPGGAHTLQVHAGDGRLTPIQLQPVALGPSSLTGAGSVRRSGGAETREHGMRCIAGPATLSFRAERDLKGESLFGQLEYDVERRSARPAVLTGDSYRGLPEPLPLDVAHGSAFLDLGHALRASVPAGAKVCLRASAVGWLSP